MPQVPTWEIVIPLAAVVVIVYTLYRNVLPYPDAEPGAMVPGRGRSAGCSWSRW